MAPNRETNGPRKLSTSELPVTLLLLLCMSPFMAETVEKVENREAPKISRMSNVVDLSRCKALQS
jgi:hypothetical protein